jgi:hypothetical protein
MEDGDWVRQDREERLKVLGQTGMVIGVSDAEHTIYH